MIFSRFDEEAKLYRYYQAGDVAPVKLGPSTNPLGSTAADDAMPAIPMFAKEIGTGEEAIGRIAKPGINWSQVISIGVKALAIYGAWRLLFR